MFAWQFFHALPIVSKILSNKGPLPPTLSRFNFLYPVSASFEGKVLGCPGRDLSLIFSRKTLIEEKPRKMSFKATSSIFLPC